MSEREDKIKEIKEVRAIIKDFANHDLYSANCYEVKYLLSHKFLQYYYGMNCALLPPQKKLKLTSYPQYLRT